MIFHTPDMPPCPACGHVLSGQAPVRDLASEAAPPDPGDVLLCIKCGAVLMLSPDRTLQVLRDDELDHQDLVPADVEGLREAQRAIQRRNRAELH